MARGEAAIMRCGAAGGCVDANEAMGIPEAGIPCIAEPAPGAMADMPAEALPVGCVGGGHERGAAGGALEAGIRPSFLAALL